MKILACDPGTTESAIVLLDGHKIERHDIMANEELRLFLCGFSADDQAGITFCVEMVACYGMAVGKEVFETCLWIGRFIEAWNGRSGAEHRLIYRRDVKLELCGNARAKDPNIRQALIDLLGPQGAKKSPGPTYGISKHEWSALAVGITAQRTTNQPTQ